MPVLCLLSLKCYWEAIFIKTIKTGGMIIKYKCKYKQYINILLNIVESWIANVYFKYRESTNDVNACKDQKNLRHENFPNLK